MALASMVLVLAQVVKLSAFVVDSIGNWISSLEPPNDDDCAFAVHRWIGAAGHSCGGHRRGDDGDTNGTTICCYHQIHQHSNDYPGSSLHSTLFHLFDLERYS